MASLTRSVRKAGRRCARASSLSRVSGGTSPETTTQPRLLPWAAGRTIRTGKCLVAISLAVRRLRMTEKHKANISVRRSLSRGDFLLAEGFRERLAEAMGAAGVNQTALAHLLRLKSVSTVNEIVSGANPKPGEPTVRRIADALRCNFDWLATGAGKRDIPLAADRTAAAAAEVRRLLLRALTILEECQEGNGSGNP